MTNCVYALAATKNAASDALTQLMAFIALALLWSRGSWLLFSADVFMLIISYLGCFVGAWWVFRMTE